MASVTRRIAKNEKAAYCRARVRAYKDQGPRTCGRKATRWKGSEGLCEEHWKEGWSHWADVGLRQRWESERGGSKRMTARANGISVKRLRALVKRERHTEQGAR